MEFGEKQHDRKVPPLTHLSQLSQLLLSQVSLSVVGATFRTRWLPAMRPEALIKRVPPPGETRQASSVAGRVTSSTFHMKMKGLLLLPVEFFWHLPWFLHKTTLSDKNVCYLKDIIHHRPLIPFPSTKAPQTFLPRHCWRCSWRCFLDDPWNGNWEKKSSEINTSIGIIGLCHQWILYNLETIWKQFGNNFNHIDRASVWVSPSSFPSHWLPTGPVSAPALFSSRPDQK